MFDFVVCCFDVSGNEGGIMYCRRECSFCHAFINLRSKECLTLRSISICRDSYIKCLFFNETLCVILQNSL